MSELPEATPDQAREERFISAFLKFVSGAIFSVGLSQIVKGEYYAGAWLAMIGAAIFTMSFYWQKLARWLPARSSDTAKQVAVDFRWWLAVLLLVVMYFVAV